MRPGLAEQVADQLIREIAAGTPVPGEPLPSEIELAAQKGISRLTAREAVKILRSANVVDVRHGSGSFVNPVREWTGVEALVLASTVDATQLAAVPRRLIEARRLLEVGVAGLAAQRRSEADLGKLHDALRAMSESHARADVQAFVDADLAFHQALVAASDNVFVTALLEPLRRVLADARYQTSAVTLIRAHAIHEHYRILAAMIDGDVDAARAAMVAHMDQTERDLQRYVVGEA